MLTTIDPSASRVVSPSSADHVTGCGPFEEGGPDWEHAPRRAEIAIAQTVRDVVDIEANILSGGREPHYSADSTSVEANAVVSFPGVFTWSARTRTLLTNISVRASAFSSAESALSCSLGVDG
jgi:hypothetical protein